MSQIRPNPDMNFLVKDSGVLIENFKAKYDVATSYEDVIDAVLEAMDSPDYLGITRGGVGFEATDEIRIIEYDGRRIRTKGDFSVDSSDPAITTNILTHTVDNMRRVLPMSDVTLDPATGKTIIKKRLGSPLEEDYLKDISWVRSMVNEDIKIETIFDAINVEPYKETGADKSESEIAVKFIGTAKNFTDSNYSPMEIVMFPKNPPTP